MSSGGIFDPAARQTRIEELDLTATEPDFWVDSEKAQTLLRERASLTTPLESWRKLVEELEEANLYLELAAEGDAEATSEAVQKLAGIQTDLDRLDLERLLGGELDEGAAIVRMGDRDKQQRNTSANKRLQTAQF